MFYLFHRKGSNIRCDISVTNSNLKMITGHSSVLTGCQMDLNVLSMILFDCDNRCDTSKTKSKMITEHHILTDCESESEPEGAVARSTTV